MTTLKTLAIHSHKGGVGKTTVAITLAKFGAMQGQKVCLVDCDFLGSGIADLVQYQRPSRYLDELLFSAEPHTFPMNDLLGAYTDRDLAQPLSLMLSHWLPDAEAEWSRQRVLMEKYMGTASAYGSARDTFQILQHRLAEEGFTLMVVDCHPGLGFISDSVRKLSDLSVLVTTPHRGDIVGLLKQVNLDKRFDTEQVFLLVNRWTSQVSDMASFQQDLREDSLHAAAMSTILGALKHLARDEQAFASIPESEVFRTLFDIGPGQYFPRVSVDEPAFAFCQQVFHRL